MIRVLLAPEPETFDEKVRQPGLEAFKELVGEPARIRRGPKREKIANRREDIPPAKFPPYWRDALPDLMTAYRRICAFTSLYIYPSTGAASVDHMVPKSREWDKVYEWSNYRLACAHVNSGKGVSSPLDPFEIEDGWFALELVGYQVLPEPGLEPSLRAAVEATIEALRLNSAALRDERGAYADDYLARQISLPFLERHAPFVARELGRQGRLHPDDQDATVLDSSTGELG